MSLKRAIQLLLGKWLDNPCIPNGKATGYSIVKSERANCNFGFSTNVIAPFFMHNVELGDYSYIARNCHISNITIGKFCSIGPNFCCGLGIHPTNGISTSPMFYSTAKQNGMTLCTDDKVQESKHTSIGNDVFIGANVTVLDGVCIGNGAVIGAGAVVVKDIPPYAIAVGVPARVVKYRFDNETIAKLQEMEWWNWSIDKLQQIEMNFWNTKDFIAK